MGTSLLELRRAVELLPSGTSLTLSRDELLHALSTVPVASDAAPVEEERWLSVAEVAEILGVSRRYVYQHATSFPFAKRLPGSALRFSKKGLARWMASR